MTSRRLIRVLAAGLSVAVIFVLAELPARGQEAADRRRAYDQLLDENVRDGFVYYRAVKSARSRLDGYVAALPSASLEGASREARMAFWLNAYNALVLRTIVDHYPVAARTSSYPARSIRQIPGAFERQQHRVAGRALTLDQIEQTILPEFGDPRLFLALGRGSAGGGRLRSEAYTAEGLDRQLSGVAAECAMRVQCFEADSATGTVRISSIFSWREKEFVAAYADKAPAVFATRSPIERAALAFVWPNLLSTEREFLERNEFKVEFVPFDWTLNDLTGRSGR